AVQVEARGRLLDSIAARTASPAETVQTLLKLSASGIFTEGRMGEAVRAHILGCLSKPGFLSGYVAAARKTGGTAAEEAMTTLIAQLGKAGITAETGLKNIAA